MTIRSANQNDLAAILDIFNYEVINTQYVYLYEPWTDQYIQEWFDFKQKNNFPLLVAELDNAVIGYGTYGKFREREAYNTTVEYSVYIHRHHRSKGVGKQLLQELIKQAKEQGYHVMVGGLDSQNKASADFHERMGFTRVAQFSQVARKFDKWLDLVFYQLLLSDA